MKNRGQKVFLFIAGLTLLCVALCIPAKSSVAQSTIDPFPGVLPLMPSPFELVSNLDFSCHRVKGGKTPVRSLEINHLNPVLQKMGFKEQRAYLGELEQLCAPVAKNQVIPPRPSLAFIRWIDLACYEAKTESNESVELELTHLNPVLRKMGLPSHKVKMARLEQVCVPVAKNGVNPPKEIRRLVEHMDVACYEIYPYEETPKFDLHLTHLNPVLRKVGLTEQKIVAEMPEQLCVPVAKNGKMPPKDILKYIQWMDFSKYVAYPLEERKPIPLVLSHLNPQFSFTERFKIELLEIEQLAVPVAKNRQMPPRWGKEKPLQ